MLEENLSNRYDVKPTHSLDELQLLHNKFPNNVRLFTSENNELSYYFSNNLTNYIWYSNFDL